MATPLADLDLMREQWLYAGPTVHGYDSRREYQISVGPHLFTRKWRPSGLQYFCVISDIEFLLQRFDNTRGIIGVDFRICANRRGCRKMSYTERFLIQDYNHVTIKYRFQGREQLGKEVEDRFAVWIDRALEELDSAEQTKLKRSRRRRRARDLKRKAREDEMSILA